MGLIEYDQNSGKYFVKRGKYQGHALEDVAQEDIRWLQWLFSDRVAYSNLEDSEAYALEDILIRYSSLPTKY